MQRAFRGARLLYLFGGAAPFVSTGAFVMPAGGALLIISLVGGMAPDTALVEGGVLDELLPQPATASNAAVAPAAR